MRKMYLLSSLFAVLSGWCGLFLAATFNLPAGASIVMVSTIIFILSVIFSPKRARNEK